MPVTAAQAKKILDGNYTFSQLGFSMMITHMKGTYAKNPSKAMLLKCTDDINSFLSKYQAIMGNDIDFISKL